MVKAVIRFDDWPWATSFEEAKSLIAFAYLVTALLFARSGLYAERAQRPGLPKIVTSLFQVTVVALLFAVVNGEQLLELLHLLRHAVLRDRLRRLDPLGLREGHGRAAARRGLPPARPARRLRAPHRGRRARARRRGARAGRDGRLHLADAAARQRPALARADRGPRRRARQRSASRRSSSPTPTSRRSQAVELVDQCHQRGVTVRIAPSTMEILVHRAEFVPGTSVPLFELRPPVFDGFDYAVKRTFDFLGALAAADRAQPAAAADRGRGLHLLARPGAVPLAAPGHRRRAVLVLQVPHHALGRRPACRPTSSRSTRPRARCSRSATTRA